MDAAAILEAMIHADLSAWAKSFEVIGRRVQSYAPGIIAVTDPKQQRLRLVLSVGVHGDETAPIEMLARLMAQLGQRPESLAVDLLVAVGNLEAIKNARRFIEADLNRLFTEKRGDLATVVEAERADQLMHACQDFLQPGQRSWHLDLHTAIRPSRFPAFAIIPDVMPPERREQLVSWLGAAGIDAVVLNTQLSPTFSAYTATRLGSSGCTLELGQIGELGKNDAAQFLATETALAALLTTGEVQPLNNQRARVFRVSQELKKLSEGFEMTVGRSTHNFTGLEPGSLIAKDGEREYRVGESTEYVIFPNPDVRVGHRAGLMVVEIPEK